MAFDALAARRAFGSGAGAASAPGGAPTLRLLIICPGSRGDVEPLLAVAQALLDDGHRRARRRRRVARCGRRRSAGRGRTRASLLPR
jgi:hypothetical protein